MSFFHKKNKPRSKNPNGLTCNINKKKSKTFISISVAIFFTQSHAATVYNETLTGSDITLNDGDSINIDDNNANNTGISQTTGNAQGTTSTKLGNNVSIKISKENSNTFAFGINNTVRNSTITANGLTIDITTNFSKTSAASRGITLSGYNTYLDLGMNSSINLNSLNPDSSSLRGLDFTSKGTLKADHLSITINNSSTKGGDNYGINAQMLGTHLDLGNDSRISVTGYSTIGMMLFGSGGSRSDGPVTLTTNRLYVESIGQYAKGIQTQSGATVDLGSGSVIKANSKGGIGSGVALRVLEGSTINAKRLTVQGLEGAHGILMTRIYDASFGSNFYDSVVNIGEGSLISAEKGGAVRNTFENGTFNYFGTKNERNTIKTSGTVGVSAEENRALSYLKYTDTFIDNKYNRQSPGYGYFATEGGTIKTEESTLIGQEGTTGMLARNGGHIELTGDTSIMMANANQDAIKTDVYKSSEAGTVKAEGKLTIQGGVKSNSGMIDLIMHSGSSWYGSAESDGLNNGYLNADLTDSRWTVLSNSNLDNLTLHHSRIALSDNKNSNAFNTLKVANLAGDGEFLFHTDVVKQLSDQLIVTGSSSGSHSVDIQNRGDLNTTGNEVLPIIFTQDGTASFKANKKTELGGYLYDLRKAGNNWELYAAEQKKQEDHHPDKHPSHVTTTANAGGNFLNVGYLLNFAETQTLLQKLSEIRQSPNHTNVWIRGTGGHFNSFASGKLDSFDMSYKGMQMGADKKIEGSLPLYIGAMVGYTQGSPNYQQGSGTVKSSNAGIYLALQNEEGFYLDGLARLSSLRNKFSVLDSQGQSVKGHGSSSGFGLTVESGQRFHLNQKGNGIYLEPQVQLSYLHQNDANLRANNGLRIGLNNYDSMLGRTSAILGYESTNARNIVSVYLKTGVVHEFAGNSVFTLNDSPESHKFKGTWWSNGIGFSANVKNSHLLYIEADTTNGDQFNQRQITGGYRYHF